MRNQVILATIAATVLLASNAGLAEPPVERILVTAVADVDQPRVLIRWRTLEGIQRYDYYDVLRRDADDTVFQKLNSLPVGPINDVASIETLFTTPGYEDAMAWIQETLGTGYATALLNLRGPNPPREAPMQLAFLPDQNYGAALALGVGFMDDTVTFGETYVYEVWGVDDVGYPVERLGRASAVAGAPNALSAVSDMDCAEPGDQRADMAAFLRWNPAVDENRYLFGYDVFRRERNGDGSCPVDMGPSDPATVKANQYPVVASAPGAIGQGRELFQSNCASCHTRESRKATTLEGFRKLQRTDVNTPGGYVYEHDTPGLDALSPDSLKMIFDYIHEFRFRDDGEDTASDPLQAGWYCYQVVPRDLLGQLGIPSSSQDCQVRDMTPPEVPGLILSERVMNGGTEVCRISWERNDDLQDGTVSYDLFRTGNDLPRNAYLDESLSYTNLPQPGAGGRVTWTDPGQTVADATHRFYYAVRSRDSAGNASPLSGWAPCVPRDVLAPDPPLLIDLLCCENHPGDCENHRSPEDPWITQGGDYLLIHDPHAHPPDPCQPRYAFTLPPDGFRVRVYRSFDNETWYPGEDIVPQLCTPTGSEYCYSPDFIPTLDQRIWHRFKTFDTSGNMSDASDSFGGIALGSLKPPAPQIFEVFSSAPGHGGMPGRVVIRFRSLKPSALLGFALYTRPLPPVVPNNWKQLVSIAKGDLVKVFMESNFRGTMPNDPDRWVLAPGAETLSGFDLPADPPGQDQFLHYDSQEDYYEMWVDIGNAEMVNLQVAAIGWSGWEGPHGTKAWDGWVSGDDLLDWPKFRKDILVAIGQPPDTGMTAVKVESFVELEWSADPVGCASDPGNDPMPFVVFRRREDNLNWQQISPPFVCPPGDPVPPIRYRDYDTDEGTWYRYMVIQLDEKGEFAWRRESDTICFYDTDFCESPQPQ